ncbi:MAG: hypothetical protein ACI376_01290 [Candidatus Bruticola sp.]
MDPISESHSKKKTSASGAIDFHIYEQLRSEIQHLKQELISASEQNVDLAIQLGQIDELNATVAERNSKIALLIEEVATLRNNINNLQESLNNETEQVKKSNQRITELLALEKELKENLKQSQAECFKLKSQIAENQASIANLQSLLAAAQASNARHMEALESLEAYISKPKENDQATTPPMLRLKNALQEVLGTAGQVIFSRTCRTLNINEANLSDCSEDTLHKAAASIIAPSLRLCRKEETVQTFKGRIRAICAKNGQLSSDLQNMLDNPGKSSVKLSTSPTVSLPSTSVQIPASATTKEELTAPASESVPEIASTASSHQEETQNEKHPAEDEVQQDIGLFVPYAYNTVSDEDEETTEAEDDRENEVELTAQEEATEDQDDREKEAELTVQEEATENQNDREKEAELASQEEATEDQNDREKEAELASQEEATEDQNDRENEAELASQEEATEDQDDRENEAELTVQEEATEDQNDRENEAELTAQEEATEDQNDRENEAKLTAQEEATEDQDDRENEAELTAQEEATEDQDDRENEAELTAQEESREGETLVQTTEVPNRTLSNKMSREFNESFIAVLDGTQTKFQDHVVDLIYKMTWKPEQISERERICARPKQINKLSQSIIRSSLDFDLDQIIEWLNYYVLPKRTGTYIPEAKLAQMSNIQVRQDNAVQDLLTVTEALNKRIFRKDRLKILFFDGPNMYLSCTKSKEPHIYYNNKIVELFNQAQQTFFAARALFSLQRGYFEIQTALNSLSEQPDYDPVSFGSTLLKRALSLASEKKISIPKDIAEEVQNAWSLESEQELLDLTERCCKITKFAQFSYIKELLSVEHPFRQSMNIEGDAFTLKFCNIYDASLVIVKLLSGTKRADHLAQKGFAELFSDRHQPQTYLQQRLSNLWLSYYINGDEFAF